MALDYERELKVGERGGPICISHHCFEHVVRMMTHTQSMPISSCMPCKGLLHDSRR